MHPGNMMIVRQQFDEFPPTPYLEQLLDITAKTYVFLWKRRDPTNCMRLSWKEITKTHNKNSFKNSLRKLNDKGLLDFEEFDLDVSIELVGWDEFED